jgi:hypothetical protein
MFSYSSPRGVSPNPRLLLYCWSVHTSVWFAPNPETGESPVLTIIDQNGESIEQPVFFRSDEDITRWDALFREDVDDEDGSGSDSGSESDAEADDDEDGTDGDDEAGSDSGSETDAEADEGSEGGADAEGDVESEEEEEASGDDEEGEEEGEVESEEEGADMDAEGGNATPTVATELSDA